MEQVKSQICQSWVSDISIDKAGAEWDSDGEEPNSNCLDAAA